MVHHGGMQLKTIARSTEDGFEVALRRRGSGENRVDELIVNGVFAMDSSQTTSERVLADMLGDPPGRVLVGGLGLGFTTARLLERGAEHVDVVELSSALVSWAEAGLTPMLAALAADPRVSLIHGDVADLFGAQESLPGVFGPWDAIALDVDNGPDFLIHQANEWVYSTAALTRAVQHLTPGGRLAIWSQGPSKQLWFDLLAIDPGATERLIPVVRGDRRIDYAIYAIRRHD